MSERAGDGHSPPLTWAEVLAGEYAAVTGEPAPDASDLPKLHARFHQRGVSALCLSGGGVRSATFALGVLQGLAHVGVLGAFDYLSTVSGGGFTGGWFTAWLHREGPAARQKVIRALDPTVAEEPARRKPVEYVRRMCRYLAPRGGLLSADVWSLFATLARNLFLNWLVILPLLAAALLVPRLYFGIAYAIEQPFARSNCLAWDRPAVWFLTASFASFAVAVGYLGLNFTGRGGAWSQRRFLALFLGPMVSGSILITLFYSAYPCNLAVGWTLGLTAALPAVGWVVSGVLLSRMLPAGDPSGAALRMPVTIRTVAAAAGAGPVIGAGVYWLAIHEFGWDSHLTPAYAAIAVPAILALMLVSIVLFVGFASPDLDDAALEWWSRCGAWLGIAAAIWLAAAGIVFYLADTMDAGFRWLDRALAIDTPHASGAILTALVPLLSSGAGLLARSAAETNQRPSAVRALVQRITLPAIIVLLLGSLAWANLRAAEALEYHQLNGVKCTPAIGAVNDDCHPGGGGIGELAILFAAFVVAGLIMSSFVPANRFSLHGMYKQRLIRTFLGASHRDRRPNAFTGFDSRDDLLVHELHDVRPLHVINATLNAVSSTRVAAHERQSETFTFSPLHAGNRETGYRNASEYGSDGGGRGTGLSLGMALAVSGAAASPAMGIFSSKARAFLLTIANARLGLWFGNPRSERVWRSSDPPLGVAPVVREMLGLTTDRNPYVYLSDGGHYDNLGLWEMVARRCRFIVVSDAGCDPDYRYDDLANATRRIRLDLGIPIKFPPMTATREGQGKGNPHGMIGVIGYSAVDGPDAADGTILYLKATLSGDEPVDVWNFAAADAAFPHDSTSDQFFDEARFESYRTLGFHTVMSLAGEFRGDGGVGGLCATVRAQMTRAPNALTRPGPFEPV
jgi:predicted acylesterase/phospholipase RssA